MITIEHSEATCDFCVTGNGFLITGGHFALPICEDCLMELKAALSPKKKPDAEELDVDSGRAQS